MNIGQSPVAADAMTTVAGLTVVVARMVRAIAKANLLARFMLRFPLICDPEHRPARLTLSRHADGTSVPLREPRGKL